MPVVDRRFVLTKGPPWGFRIYLDNKDVLTISKIRRHSPAENAKLRSGDQIISINGKLMKGLGHAEVVMFIDTTFGTMDIQISRFESITTQVLTFDKMGFMLPDDVKAKMNMSLNRSDQTYAETKVPKCTPEPEECIVKTTEETKVPKFSPEPEKCIFKANEESAPLEVLVRPSSPSVQPVPLSKLMKKYDFKNDSDDHVPKKKYFADSSFYNDPYNLYPTAEEKMEMARRVASSLYDTYNKSSKGASIFEKQRKRADKYTIQKEESTVNGFTIDEPKYDLAHWPTVAEHKERSPSPMFRLGYSTGSVPPVPPPPPPPGPNEARNIQDFIEKAQKFPKTKHNAISPDVCFDIAAALHSCNSRGAQIFAQQKHRAQKWTLTTPDVPSVEPVLAFLPGPMKTSTQPFKVDQKPMPKIVSISHNQNQFCSNEKSSTHLSSATSARKPSHVIRRNSNQGPNEPLKIGNKLSITTSSSVETSVSITEPALSATATKWKPVKFNIPQRA